MSKEPEGRLVCPVCGSRVVGDLGGGHYYCWECFVQFAHSRRGVTIYRIDPDGTLVSVTADDIRAYHGYGDEDEDDEGVEAPGIHPKGAGAGR